MYTAYAMEDKQQQQMEDVFAGSIIHFQQMAVVY